MPKNDMGAVESLSPPFASQDLPSCKFSNEYPCQLGKINKPPNQRSTLKNYKKV